MSSQTVETWRVMTPEGVFEADLDTLKQWIVEGCVLPNDKVAKGNLNWIDAGRAPSLRRAFSGEVDVSAVPATPPESVFVSEPVPETANAEPAYSGGYAQQTSSQASYSHSTHSTSTQSFAQTALPAGTACLNHPDIAPFYICRACDATFCKSCPTVVNQIPICPACGDLCKPFQEMRERAVRREYQAAGFGFAEFGKSLAYPFKNIFGVIGMAILYAFLLFGGFKGQLVAWGVLFGCMSNVISQFAWGRTDRGMFSNFDSFSFYEDIIRPLFLSIGIFVVTLGPMIVLIIALFFGLFSSFSPSRPRATPTPPPSVAEESQTTDEDMDALVEGNDPEKEAAAAKKVQRLHPGQRMSEEMERQKEPAIPLSSMLGMLGISGAIIGLFLLALGWAFFYYPMALAVAGYTEDFKSVINPLVGLDTMRRMGWTYVKAFFMYLGVQGVGIVLIVITGIILAPFDMPFFGNLPAQFVHGIITFYTSLVVACILGFALFKCADKLGINTD
jgi:hypothetical protein